MSQIWIQIVNGRRLRYLGYFTVTAPCSAALGGAGAAGVGAGAALGGGGGAAFGASALGAAGFGFSSAFFAGAASNIHTLSQ